MLDAFIEKIPFDADDNRFLLVNTIFKRIKHLAHLNVEKLNPMTSDEIVDKAYLEIKTGEVKPMIQDNVIKAEKVKVRKKLKEVPFTEKPAKGTKAKSKKLTKSKSKK